ncbi:Protein tanc2, partial [Nowakowskiella sp. JEL0078]
MPRLKKRDLSAVNSEPVTSDSLKKQKTLPTSDSQSCEIEKEITDGSSSSLKSNQPKKPSLVKSISTIVITKPAFLKKSSVIVSTKPILSRKSSNITQKPSTLKKVGSIVARLRDRNSIRRTLFNVHSSVNSKSVSHSFIEISDNEPEIIETDSSDDEDYVDQEPKTKSRDGKSKIQGDESDSDEEGNASWEDVDRVLDETPKKRKSRKGKKPATQKTPKMKLNEEKKTKKKTTKNSSGKLSGKTIAQFKSQIKDNFESRESKIIPDKDISDNVTSHVPDTKCCCVCSSREYARAAASEDIALLDATFEASVAHYSFGVPPDDPNSNALAIAIRQGNQEIIRKLLKNTYGNPPPQRYLTSGTSTGSVHINTFGHELKQVNESRGNREGNNAFFNKEESSPYDENSEVKAVKKRGGRNRFSSQVAKKDLSLLNACRSTNLHDEIMDRLYLDHTDYIFSMTSWGFQEAVAAGNRKIAIKILEKIQHSGFNDLYREALILEAGESFSNFRTVSVLKKCTGNFSISPLHCAAINPNVEFIEKLINSINPSEILHTDDLGRVAIHYAAGCESPGPLKFLLQHMTHQSVDSSKYTPLLLAAKYGRAENVRVLVDAAGGGADSANATFLLSGSTALHIASHYGHLEVVEVLIEFGANVNAITKGNKMTPLIEASKMGHLQVVSRLIEAGAYIFMGDNMGKTPLHYAAKNGRFEIVVKLLSLGADTEWTDSSLNTPLHYACGYGWKKISNILIEYGNANINALNCWKYAPIAIADLKGHREIVKYLLNNPKIDVNFLNKDGFTLIHTYVMQEIKTTKDANETYETLKLMLDNGGNPNTLSVNGENALHLIAEKMITKQNHSIGSNTFGTAQASQTLQLIDEEASKNFQIRMAKLLFEHKVEVDSENNNEKTPLAISISKKKLFLAGLFLENGASLRNIRFGNGRNFLHEFVTIVNSVEMEYLKAPQKVTPEGFKDVQ